MLQGQHYCIYGSLMLHSESPSTTARPESVTLAQLQAAVQQQGQELLRLRAMVSQLQQARQAAASELADFSSACGSLRLYRAGREMPLHPRQRQAITGFEDKLARGEYRMAPHPCPCGAHDDQLLTVRDRYGLAVNTVICRICGLMRIDPYYTPETLKSFYSHEYDDIYARTAQSFERKFAQAYADPGRGSLYLQHLRQHRVPLKGRRVYEIGCGGVDPQAFPGGRLQRHRRRLR